MQELDYTVNPEPTLISMDTASDLLIVGTVYNEKINLQYYKKGDLSKVKEMNLPAQLKKGEQIAELIILKTNKLSVLLKTFTQENIYVKHILIEAPGLIPKPREVLDLPNKNLELTVSEENLLKSVNKQVQIVCSPNKGHIAILNKQSLVCNIDSKGLEIYNYNQDITFQNKFQASNCGLRDLHLFDNGMIALAKAQHKRIELEVYANYFQEQVMHYTFPEIIKKSNSELSDRNDTFDQQVQFYFDEARIYGYIKGFVNNNYISHVGLYIYDINTKAQIATQNSPKSVGSFLNYSLLYRDFFKGYSYEYPMHLRLRYIKEKKDKTFEVVGDYMSYGRMLLGNDFAGHAQSEATYIMHLRANGSLIKTKILLHKQSIISYPSDKKALSGYEVNADRVNFQVGQIYLYNSTDNYVLHNNDKKAFYSEDKLYRYNYLGKDGVIALVRFNTDIKKKTKVDSMAQYTLLPMQTTMQLSSENAIVFALENKSVKLLSVSLAKP